MPLLYDQLLVNSVINAGLNLPLYAANRLALQHRSEAVYLLKVFNAGYITQLAVLDAARAENSELSNRLAAILSKYLSLPQGVVFLDGRWQQVFQKTAFIEAFKKRAGLTGGMRYISAQTSWGSGKKFEPGPPPGPPPEA